MSAGTLYISFWKICLNNLPDTTFEHRQITVEEAKLLIKQTRKEKRLLGLSEADLLAPHREHDRETHEALCKVLKKHFGISLTLKDFVTRFGSGQDASYCINPLNCFQIRGKDRLLIMTCGFGLRDRKQKKRLAFKIDPMTVAFHLLKCVSK